MWQNKFDSRLVLEPVSSRYLLIYLLVLHALALAALAQPLQLSLWLRVVLSAAVVFSLTGWVWRYRRDRIRPNRLIWRTDGHWDYQTRQGYFDDLRLLPSSYITGWLIILHLARADGGRIHVVLLPDSLSKEQWHVLWLRLKYVDFVDT